MVSYLFTQSALCWRGDRHIPITVQTRVFAKKVIGDISRRMIMLKCRLIASLTRFALDHHSTYPSLAASLPRVSPQFNGRRILNTTMEVPPSVFLEGVVDSAGVGNDQETRQPLLPLPLQVSVRLVRAALSLCFIDKICISQWIYILLGSLLCDQ